MTAHQITMYTLVQDYNEDEHHYELDHEFCI